LRWLPEPFQSKLLAQQLSKKQLFVAVNEADGIIISLRKVLIVDDQDELSKILAQDLRCAHAQRELIEYGFFDCTLEFFQEAHEHFMPSQQILYMHVGSAFTHHAHRGKRINEQLSLYAYEQLHEEVCRKMLVYNYTTIALIYSLLSNQSV
jgi:hypothetical protein